MDQLENIWRARLLDHDGSHDVADAVTECMLTLL